MKHKRKHNKGAAKLKKIVAKAKKIYKKGHMKWTSAIKQAAKKV